MTIRNFWQNQHQLDIRPRIQGPGFPQVNNVWYVYPQGNGPDGSYTTLAQIKSSLRTRDLIYISGVLREQFVTPDNIFDVTIMGAANAPRQATSGGVPTATSTFNYGGASWLGPASPTALTPLIEVKSAGWNFVNIEFTPVASSAAIRLTRSASVDLTDASHATIDGCYFAANGVTTPIGIEDNGGCRSITITNSRFEALASAVLGLSTSAAVPLDWLIARNKFMQNTNDIRMSLSYARIMKNQFLTAGAGATNKVISTTFLAVQGGNNHILLNQFTNTEAQIAPGSGYTGAATDTWMNYVIDQAALAFGQPA